MFSLNTGGVDLLISVSNQRANKPQIPENSVLSRLEWVALTSIRLGPQTWAHCLIPSTHCWAPALCVGVCVGVCGAGGLWNLGRIVGGSGGRESWETLAAKMCQWLNEDRRGAAELHSRCVPGATHTHAHTRTYTHTPALVRPSLLPVYTSIKGSDTAALG